MKAVIYEGPNVLTYKDVGDVSPKCNEVKIKVRACGICGSDIHGYLGITGRRIPPVIMGHEFAGEIIQLGEGVNDLETGDRVAVYPLDFCGECEMCKKRDMHLCLNKRAFGVLDVDGAFAEYICVPSKVCFKLNDNISYKVGSLMEPLAVSYRAVKHLGDLSGKDVLIIGAGTIGLLALACAKMQNPNRIFVSDLSDYRLEIAKNMGADIVINSSLNNLHETIMTATNNKGVESVAEAVGITETVKQGIDALAFGGTAVWIGISSKHIDLEMQQVVTRELKVKGSFLYGYDEFKEVVGYLNDGLLNVEPILSQEIALRDLPETMAKLAVNPGNLIKVTVIN
ncbi:alcohol dehydrogenase catalytic domain-containing protein [Sedimentibacter sp.]|uniref:zinc-dependent alcohol dehydrogenase n=1 Tax=Sedimentibacter sp. TaxID=1960295 RepID=UPI0028A12F5B|nr:alcohol dehydrogenase catalytic domain-containing protein [Sedimentibacter sp.]